MANQSCFFIFSSPSCTSAPVATADAQLSKSGLNLVNLAAVEKRLGPPNNSVPVAFSPQEPLT
jgi:hypothetical protein